MPAEPAGFDSLGSGFMSLLALPEEAVVPGSGAKAAQPPPRKGAAQHPSGRAADGPDELVTRMDLATELEAHRAAWSAELRTHWEALAGLSDRVEAKLSKTHEVFLAWSTTADARAVELESMLWSRLERFERASEVERVAGNGAALHEPVLASLRQAVQRHEADIGQLRSLQCESGSHSEAAAQAAAEAVREHVKSERAELLETLAKVCSQIEELQGQNDTLNNELQALKRHMRAESQSHCSHVQHLAGHLREVHSSLVATVGQVRGEVAKIEADLHALRADALSLAGRQGSVEEAVQHRLREEAEAFKEHLMVHLEDLRAQQGSVLDALQDQDCKREADLKSVREGHAQDVEDLRAQHSSVLDALQDQDSKREADLRSVREGHMQEVEGLRAQMVAILDALRRQDQRHEAERRSIQESHAQQVEALRTQHKGAVETLRQHHDITVNVLSGGDWAAALERPAGAQVDYLAADGAESSCAGSQMKLLATQGDLIQRLQKQQSVLQAQQGLEGKAVEAVRTHCARLEASQGQLACDIGSVKAQLLDGLKAVRNQIGKQGAEIEALWMQTSPEKKPRACPGDAYLSPLTACRGVRPSPAVHEAEDDGTTLSPTSPWWAGASPM